MNRPTFFLDVNVPMYAAGTDHPHKAACVWVMREIAEGRLDAAIDTEVIQEILHRFSSIRRPRIGIVMAENLIDLMPTTYPVTIVDVRKTIALFVRHAAEGIMARDALHAAVMQNNGLTYILSTDQHFDRIDGISRVGVETLDQIRAELDRLNR